jgi:hypothetical protein
MNEEGRVKRQRGHGSSTEGRRRAEPRGEQVFLAGENAACLRIIQPEPSEKDVSLRPPIEAGSKALFKAAIQSSKKKDALLHFFKIDRTAFPEL